MKNGTSAPCRVTKNVMYCGRCPMVTHYLSPPLDNIRRSDSIGEIDVTIQGDFLPCYGSYVRSIRVSRHCKKRKINVSLQNPALERVKKPLADTYYIQKRQDRISLDYTITKRCVSVSHCVSRFLLTSSTTQL